MKTKITFLGLLSLLIIITITCQKDDTPACSYPKNAKLKRIVGCSNFDLTCPTIECKDFVGIEKEYEYDQRDRIEKVMIHPRYVDGVLTNPTEYHLYEYNSNGQLVKIEYHHAYGSGDTRRYLHEKNHIYTYSDYGKKIEEYIHHVESGSFQYKLYKYTNDRLTRIENYKLNTDELENYILYEYDNSGNLIKETTIDNDGVAYVSFQHIFENGLNVRSYQHGSEFIKTYDENNNLILLESFHPTGSSKGNTRLKYEYYD